MFDDKLMENISLGLRFIYLHKSKKDRKQKQTHTCSHVTQRSNWWLIQMEPWAVNQIFAHMIYPAFLKARVLRNIQTPLCLHVFVRVAVELQSVCECVVECVCVCSPVILQACIHTHSHAQSPEG